MQACRRRSSFFFLLELSSDEAGFFAFADRDDVWKTEMRSRAVSHLKKLPGDRPPMYCSAVTPVAGNLDVIAKPSSPRRPRAFENALVQKRGHRVYYSHESDRA